MRHIKRLALATTALCVALQPAAAQKPPASPVLRIDPTSTPTAAPVQMQDGSGHWKPIGTLNPTTGAFLPQGQDAVAAIANAALPVASAGLVFGGLYLTDTMCLVDQTANVQRAVAAAGPGGYVQWPKGCILLSNTVTSNGQKWSGAGYGASKAPGGTQFQFNQPAGVAFKLVGDGAKLSDLWLSNSLTTTSAVAVQLGDGAGSNPSGQALDFVHMVGFSTQLDIQSGQFWHLDHFDLYNAQQFAVRIRNLTNSDSGDGVINGGVMRADGTIGQSAIRYESGGGLKLFGTKILQFGTAFDLRVADGANTQNLTIDGTNSFENQSVEAVHLGRLGTTGIFRNIKAHPQVDGGKSYVGAGLSGVVIGGIYDHASYAWNIAGGDNIVYDPTTVAKNMSVAAVVVNDPATHVKLPQSIACVTCGSLFADNRFSGVTSTTDEQLVDVTSNSVATPVYDIFPTNFGGTIIQVDVSGIVQNGGVTSMRQVRQVLNTGFSNLVLSTAGTDASAGVPIQVNYDLTTVPGAVRVSVQRRTDYGGTEFQGVVRVNVVGKVALLRRVND